jgi:hypothetical protein
MYISVLLQRSCLMVVYTVVSSQVVSCLLQYPSLSLEFMGSCLACWSAAVSGSCHQLLQFRQCSLHG